MICISPREFAYPGLKIFLFIAFGYVLLAPLSAQDMDLSDPSEEYVIAQRSLLQVGQLLATLGPSDEEYASYHEQFTNLQSQLKARDYSEEGIEELNEVLQKLSFEVLERFLSNLKLTGNAKTPEEAEDEIRRLFSLGRSEPLVDTLMVDWSIDSLFATLPTGILGNGAAGLVQLASIPTSGQLVIIDTENKTWVVDSEGNVKRIGDNEKQYVMDEGMMVPGLDYEYFVSDDDAWRRLAEAPYSAVKPTPDLPKVEQGKRVAVIETVKDGRGKEVAKIMVQGQSDAIYTTLNYLSKVVKLSKELKYKMLADFESVSLPYGTEKAGKSYVKETEFMVDARCGDYVRVKGEGDDRIEGHWMSKDAAVVDCGTGFCCQRCGEDLTLNIAKLQIIYGDKIASSYVEPLNTALKKGGFNTHASHAHFFAQSKKEVGMHFSLDEKPNLRLHTVLRIHAKKAAVKHFFQQTFWNDETYLDYFQYYVFQKAAEDYKGIRYQGTNEKRFTHSSNSSIQVPTFFIVKKEERYQKVIFNDEEKNARNKKLFSYIYADKFGNGAPSTEDGWNFRGRGLIHLTWRENYKRASTASGEKLEYLVDWQTNYTTLSTNPKDAVYSAVAYFLFKLNGDKFKKLHQSDNAREISILVNGGLEGWPERGDNFDELIGSLFICEEQ
ncbi:hypothetical protein [Marinoscillum sp. MHG1-6]|uniref:hypothetical protein n=1 Tax=Marinoscillum sp. MHG1-6 TaxID=2959627 RepID=UPI002157D11D|nr:hypothetical protein [Marinoscillum sp. MHG1-6]